jgi:hypothetical protein
VGVVGGAGETATERERERERERDRERGRERDRERQRQRQTDRERERERERENADLLTILLDTPAMARTSFLPGPVWVCMGVRVCVCEPTCAWVNE